MIRTGGMICAGLALAAASIVNAEAQPSFDCGYAKKASEKAICDFKRLGKLDVATIRNYVSLIKALPSDAKMQLRWEQNAWLVTRNKCGYSSYCIEQSYRSRTSRLTHWRTKYSLPR